MRRLIYMGSVVFENIRAGASIFIVGIFENSALLKLDLGVLLQPRQITIGVKSPPVRGLDAVSILMCFDKRVATEVCQRPTSSYNGAVGLSLAVR